MLDIGLLNEKPLHTSLKEWIAQPEDQIETIVDGFVIDIVRDDLRLEIQTGHFASIKSKFQIRIPLAYFSIIVYHSCIRPATKNPQTP